MDIDYARLEENIDNGTLRDKLEQELTSGFQALALAGETLPPPSHYASRIAEIINRSAERPLSQTAQFDLYQEVLLACERARALVLGSMSS